MTESPSEERFEAGVREGLWLALVRTERARDSLWKAYGERVDKDDPSVRESYGMAIDELDKIVFACRSMRESKRARDRFKEKVK